jgi:hypothetical protein
MRICSRSSQGSENSEGGIAEVNTVGVFETIRWQWQKDNGGFGSPGT